MWRWGWKRMSMTASFVAILTPRCTRIGIILKYVIIDKSVQCNLISAISSNKKIYMERAWPLIRTKSSRAGRMDPMSISDGSKINVLKCSLCRGCVATVVIKLPFSFSSNMIFEPRIWKSISHTQFLTPTLFYKDSC